MVKLLEFKIDATQHNSDNQGVELKFASLKEFFKVFL